jgi:NAD(P)-dependent dehydrogenase (short-subunit alcohol dehydrogenase family)
MNKSTRIGLENKMVLITGGYGYLGSEIAKAVVEHGGTAVILGRSKEKFNKLSERIEQAESIHFINCDIDDTNSVKKSFAHIESIFGCIDVLINNAYFGQSEVPEKMSDEAWQRGIDGGLNSVFRCMREVIPYLKDGGRIINISSMYGSVSPDFSIYEEFPGFLNPPNYGSAKAAVQQLTRYFAAYLGKRGINVNCVSPGPFPSPEVQSQSGFIEKLKQRTVLNRIGKPDEIGGICVFLASEHSSFITGQNIFVDGGWTIR